MTSKNFISSYAVASLLCLMSTSVAAGNYGGFRTFPNLGSDCSCLDVVNRGDGSANMTLTLTECAAKPSQMIGQETGKYYAAGHHFLQFQATGNVLDVSGNSVLFGSEVIHWPQKKHGERRDNQRWRIVKVGEFYHIRNKNSGLCLTANDNVNYKFELLQNTCCSKNNFQLWDLDHTQCSVPETPTV